MSSFLSSAVPSTDSFLLPGWIDGCLEKTPTWYTVLESVCPLLDALRTSRRPFHSVPVVKESVRPVSVSWVFSCLLRYLNKSRYSLVERDPVQTHIGTSSPEVLGRHLNRYPSISFSWSPYHSPLTTPYHPYMSFHLPGLKCPETYGPTQGCDLGHPRELTGERYILSFSRYGLFSF